MVPQELDKVLSIETYAEMITSWTPLKSCHQTVVKRKKRTVSTGHPALKGVSQLKRNPSQNYTG